MTIMNLPDRATLLAPVLIRVLIRVLTRVSAPVLPRVSTTVSATVLVLLMSAPSLAFVNLSSHRAVYDLKLKSSHKRSGVKDLTGRMVIEMTGSDCEGWSVNFRLVNDFQLSRGKRRLVDSRSTSWESADGSQMSFFEREFIDNRPYQVTRLKASLKNHKVKQKQPKKLVFDIPEGTIFPVAHQKRLIEKAREGIFRDKSIVYDGADHDNIYQAITFIGKQRKGETQPKTLKGDGANALLGDKISWPVTVSYYSLKDKRQQDTPSQQIDFLMYENGIAGDLTIDYGDFAMSGKLIHLDKLPQSKCQQ